MTTRRVALVTGAAQGIGQAIALRFLRDGVAVVATDVKGAGLADTARQSNSPDLIHTLEQDVSGAEAPRQAVQAAIDRFGRLDYLVNNAGIGDASPLHQTDDAKLDRYLDINLRSVMRFSREAIAVMESGAAIVHIASIFGILGNPGSAPYSATKAALIGLAKQMAADYGPRGIRVNAVAPGIIDSPLTRDRLEKSARFRQLLVQATPFPRIGTPEDIAKAVRFLCSDEAAFVNGHTLVVDGGWSVTNYIAETG
jgi:NAD(P)-dependent dehydrogenase (short-subunit alcohol dehydrogenase family)